MLAMLTADWFPLGRDIYFRKFELYPLSFQNEVSNNNMLVAAPYGGSIAVTRNPNKLVKVQGVNKPMIYLYTSSGKLTAKFQWNGGQLVLLGWSQQEELLCIEDDGMVHIYDMFGTYQHTFSMGNEVKDTKVVEAKFFASYSGTGIAVLTSVNRIFLVNNIVEPKVRQISDIPRYGGQIECWCLVHCDRETRVILSNRDGIFVIHQSHQAATHIPFDNLFTKHNKVSSVIAMVVSGNNRHIALYMDTGHLYMEIDGIRVLSGSSHEMIQKVPNVVQKIFRINSTDPASYLLEASKQFQKRSHKADSYMDLVKDKLDAAIKACIDGASHEFDFGTQKLLMRAAKFGKGFSRTINPEYYVNMCRTLRVLNAVRHSVIGIPLTYTQFTVLTSQVLLDRLVARRHYYLSIQIARHLQLPEIEGESRILAHWACYKVKQTQLDKEQIAEEIADKLGYAPGVSYSEIARRAADCGRKQLAIKLIDYEPRAHQQVPLLLTLGEEKAALHKAVESGNTDLVYIVILHLRENMPLGDFQMSIMHCPLAMALYIKYCQNHNRETLRDIYNQYDDFHSQAIWFITESYQRKNTMSREALLQSAQENFKLARSDSNATLTEEQIKLLRYQKSMEDVLQESIVGKPLHDTVKVLLLRNELKLADKLRSEYKISDRRYWWLRIQCLAEKGMWNELEKFSKSKKCPIGYEPFVDECLKYNEEREAKKYLPKIRDELKVKYLVKLKMINEAVQTAMEQKDVNALTFLLAQCKATDRQLIDKINMYITSLKN
ncbi:Vacuolar protein sorting-associated protein 16 like protein [Melipona quadrifasciata]|uniref:Vacuolar protein sorting-associated protein 16 homolog n=1 Tax=Melipona quadrifasciata TaxID=166423 RepID=A0A0M8ZYH7_9HYME|nr:Vacuolar protein sorting-associated protein 16 like protein [Melipona quadrifasciata]